MNPTAVLAWMQVVTEVGTILARLMELGTRMQAGHDVTPAELAELRRQTTEAVARWKAAAPADREVKP